MAIRFDHAVIAVSDLAAATANFRAQGFTVSSAGPYPDGVPRTACIAFEQGSFLELAQCPSSGPSSRTPDERGGHDEGLVTFALESTDLPGVVSRVNARGMRFEEPVRESRALPGGEQARWLSSRPMSTDLPLLVGDVTPRALRVPEGDARRHRNGSVGVESIVVAVQDAEVSSGRYRAVVGEEGRVEGAVHLSTPGLRVVVIRLGKTDVVLAAPEGRDTPKARIGQLVRDRLERRGEGPVAITLRLAKGSAPVVFDESRTHAVPLDAVV